MAGSGVTWRGESSLSTSVCPATLLTTSSPTLCCQTAQMARAAGKASWGPGGPGLSLCRGQPRAELGFLEPLAEPRAFPSPGLRSRLSLGVLLPFSPSWDRSAAALPSYLPRASPLLRSFCSRPITGSSHPKAASQAFMLQLPDLHVLMLMVWKRFMVGFVLSFLCPELSSAWKKERPGSLDLK